MKRHTAMRMLLGGFATMILLAGCGGGGGGAETSQGPVSPPAGSASVLAWAPPTTYNDNVALDPERDLEYYEIFVSLDANFADGDAPVAQVAAVAAGSLVTEFTLDLIDKGSLPAGSQLFVSMRSVGVDHQKSAFMAPIAWYRI